jgi:hypothetical protein
MYFGQGRQTYKDTGLDEVEVMLVMSFCYQIFFG